MSKAAIKPLLKNPFDPPEKVEFTIPGEISRTTGGYEEAMKEGYDLIQRPIKSVKIEQIEKQHFKKRMTVWERLVRPFRRSSQCPLPELGQES